MEGASATAEGELARTPLAHLLVYALDRRLTGAMFLSPPQGVEHVVRFARGVPIKVRPGDRHALLGQMLLDAGAIDEKTLAGALATQGLLGDVLLLAGRVERDALEKVAEDQFRRRMVRLFALPPETAYRYYDGHEELAEYGGDPAAVDPLALLWAGLRTHGEVSAMMEGTLARLGETPLRLHPAATVARFGLEPEETKILDDLVARPVTLAELCAASFPGMARRLAYALAITRQVELGTGLLPLGAEAAPAARSSPGTAVARMSLRSHVHRLGAAAPDAPGDGERVAPVPSRRQRDRMASGAGDEPPSSRTSVLPPVSSVEPVPTSAPPPDSGVVAVEHAAAAAPVAVAPVAAAPAPPSDRATTLESETLRSQLHLDADPALLDEPPAPELELEEAEADDDEVAALFDDGWVVPVAGAEELAAEVGGAQADAVTAEKEVAAREEAGEIAVDDVVEEVAEEEGSEAPSAEVPAAAAAESAEDPFAGMTAPELFWLATEALAQQDAEGAVEACDAGRRAEPDDADLVALGAWARAQLGGADLKALMVDLDEVLRAHDAHVEARYYRGMLRRRLGDQAGCTRDLRRVVELAPGHEGACRELATLDEKAPQKLRPSLFGKLFKR